MRMQFLIVGVVLLAMPASAVLPETTAFFRLMNNHSDLFAVYPEWFVGSEVVPMCFSSMPDITCVAGGSDIQEISLTRSLTGEFQPGEVQFISQLPLLRKLSIKNSPSFFFYMPDMSGATLVQRIEIENSGLSGAPPVGLELCSALTYVRITHTHLSGTLPSGIAELPNLQYLEISDSALTNVGAHYGNMLGLRTLNFRSNSILMPIPTSLGQAEALEELYLDDNTFVATIPAELVNLGNLKVLALSSNQLAAADGGLFDGITTGPLKSSLRTLLLDHNIFGPRLPDLTGYSSLQHLGLSHNHFSEPATSIDATHTQGFNIGVTGASLLELFVNHNKFKVLFNYVTSPFFGPCDFRDNLLCYTATLIPNIYLYAQCDLDLLRNVCGTTVASCGDNSCRDCLGVPFGTAAYDACDVCAGTSATCLDCAGVPNGPAVYNDCAQCSVVGDASCPKDCMGVTLGTSVYDECDVCNGNNACLDCAGVPGGSSAYDVCDVCNGRGHTCLDCAGVLHGSALLDECGVCRGDGTACAPPITVDYLKNQGAFRLFVGLSILLAILILGTSALLYLLFTM